MSAAAWSVHLPTALETCIRVAIPHGDDGGPWPVARALTAVQSLGAERTGAPRVLGAGHGLPLLAAYSLHWQGCDLHVEALHHTAAPHDEVALALPPWDELIEAVPDEDTVWEFVDVFAGAVDARYGAVVDGEPLTLVEPRTTSGMRELLGRHIAVLLPTWLAATVPPARASRYRSLPASGLEVFLR